MYSIFHRSRFITRCYCPNDELLRKITRHVIKSYSKYHKEPISLDECIAIEDLYVPKSQVKVKISLFNEFKYEKELKRIVANMEYPDGLYVSIEIAEKKINDINDKKDINCIHIFESNIKLFFEKEDKEFAFNTAKCLLNSSEYIKCVGVYSNRIVLEWCDTLRCDTHAGVELLRGEFSELEDYVDPVNVISDRDSKLIVEVFDQFKFKPEVSRCLDIFHTRLIKEMRVKNTCEFNFIGERNVKIKCNPYYKDLADELLKLILDFSGDEILETKSLLHKGLHTEYVIILTINDMHYPDEFVEVSSNEEEDATMNMNIEETIYTSCGINVVK